MTLFLFSSHGQLFALPGEMVRQVLFPGAHNLSVEPGGRHATHAGRRLPMVELPGAELDLGAGAPGEELTFLHLAHPEEGECLLAVEGAGGLTPVGHDTLMELPGYLFPGGRPLFDGLFLRDDKPGLLLRPDALRQPGRA